MISRCDLLITGGQIILPCGPTAADIAISDGRIQALLAPGSVAQARQVVQAGGLLLLSGVIDTHVHYRTGTSHRDDIREATRGAARGGATTVLGYVRSTEGKLLEQVALQKALVPECPLDIAFHGAITSKEDWATAIPALIEQGIRSFKFYMAYQREGLGISERVLYEGFKLIARLGGVAIVHAEHPDIIEAQRDELIRAGRTRISDFGLSRPVAAETEAIRRALALAELAGCPLTIAHVSSMAGLALITEQKQRRLLNNQARPPVYAESCPQYILLNESALETMGANAIVAPPLRSPENQEGLLRALFSGAIDVLGSDHSLQAVMQKGGDSFVAVNVGAPGVQTFFPVLLSQALEEDAAGRDVHPLFALQRASSETPARVFGLYPRKGRLGVGADADIVFVDPAAQWTVTPEWEGVNAVFSLWQGRRLTGRPIHSLRRGEWLLRDGALATETGGEYLARSAQGAMAAHS